ncbi:MAG: tetratricopeptide repeat protein [Sphingobium sp.]
MSILLAAFLAAGIDPETEAVMGRRKTPAERRIQQEQVAAPAIDPALEDCVDLARRDSTAAIARARSWIARSNGPSPQQCLGFAQAQGQHWSDALAAFREGARLAGPDGAVAARLWAQAGNAALLGGDMAGAVAALDNALAGTALPDGLARGEAYLDRARAHVALKDEKAARSDLDNALRLAPQDPLAWLLSATLARRMGDLTLAKQHIGEAVSRAPDDASVALEQGVIAALSVDDVAARAAFQRARKLGAGSPVETAAAAYLTQLGDTVAPAAPAPTDKPPQSR